MRPEPHGAHTFILRVRLQPREIAAAAPIWYGTIEHLPSGESERVKTLAEVNAFIVRYLEQRPS